MAPYLLRLLFPLLLFSDPVATAAPPPSSLFVLGDSTANCHDSNVISSLLRRNFSLTPCSNRLLPDFIAEKMGISPTPPFYTPNGSSSFAAYVRNFATPQGTILSPTNSFSSPTLSSQLRQVAEVLQLLQLEYGPIAAHQVASPALFLLSFGTDDFLRFLRRKIGSNLKTEQEKMSRLLVSHMVRAIKDLYYADATRIAVIGVAPIGCMPHVVLDRSSGLDGRRCVVEVNELIKGYNDKLKSRLGRLRSELLNAEIVFCDVYKSILEIISNPQIYGFENVRDPCCAVGPLATTPCVAKEMACVKVHRHVWWDSYSTTEVVNSLIADWLWSNSSRTSVCQPLPLQHLAGTVSSSR